MLSIFLLLGVLHYCSFNQFWYFYVAYILILQISDISILHPIAFLSLCRLNRILSVGTKTCPGAKLPKKKKKSQRTPKTIHMHIATQTLPLHCNEANWLITISATPEIWKDFLILGQIAKLTAEFSRPDFCALMPKNICIQEDRTPGPVYWCSKNKHYISKWCKYKVLKLDLWIL